MLRVAAHALRSGGTTAISVQRVVSGAQLTPGAFYAHFPDKAALVDEALLLALEERMVQLGELLMPVPPADWLDTLLDDYLSGTHRDRRDDGCSLPSILAEAAIGRSSISEGTLSSVVVSTRDSLRSLDSRLTEHQATSLLALLIGAQTIARSLGSTGLSDAVLAAARDQARVMVRSNRPPDPVAEEPRLGGGSLDPTR